MKATVIWSIGLMVTSLMWLALPGPSFAQTTSFTYQGKLFDGGAPDNGPFDFECKNEELKKRLAAQEARLRRVEQQPGLPAKSI